ncbi:MAG: FtsX-like permease family protein, partial [Gemmatimonadaceae bacterium]
YEQLFWADDGSPPSALPPGFQTTTTSSGYFRTMRIPLIAGRSYDEANVRRGVNEAVVSRGVIEHFWHDSAGRSGVGKRVRPAANGPWFTIVGVVSDVRDSSIARPPISEVYFPEEASLDTANEAGQTTVRDMAFVVRTNGPQPGVPARLAHELRALDPNLPFHRPATMEQIVTDARSETTFALALLTFGAAATLTLGIVGLYGVIAYVVTLRSQEISLRIALGLAPDAATWMIVRQGEAIIGLGLVLGVCAFVAFARLLEGFVFGVGVVDGVTIGVATIGVLAVATAAVWVPARRAARMDPAAVLSAG